MGNSFRWVQIGAALGMAAVPLGAGQDAFGQQATQFAPVTVTATKTQRSIDEVPAHVGVIGNEEIEQRAPSKIDDLFRDLPGVDMTGGPRRLGQDISIRGMGGQRVVTKLDGARQNFDAGHKGRFFLDPDLLRQVEVVRGSNSALHGSGAIGGVVSMETKKAADFLNPGENVGFRTKYGYSSVARENYYSLGAFGRVDDKVDLLVNGSYRDSGTLKQGGHDRELDNSAEDLKDLLLKTTFRPAEHHQASVSVIRFNEKGLTPTNPDGAPSSSNPFAHRVTDMATYALNYSYSNPDMPLLNPTLQVYRNDLDVLENRRPTPRRDETYLTTTGFDLYNTARFETGAVGHAVTFGTEYFQDDQSARRNGAARPEYPTAEGEVAGYYVQDEIELVKGLTVTPALRFDTYESSATVSRPIEESQLSPRLGANWQALPWLGFYGSYGHAFRAPSLLETYVSGQHFPGNSFIPNPDLRPEKTKTVEGGFRLNFDDVATARDALRLNATYFHTEAEDFIEQVISATTTTNRNIPKAEIRGAELSAQYDTPFAFAGIGYARIRGDNEQTGRPINSIPADKLTTVIGGKLPEHGLRFGLRSEFAAEQDRVDTSGTATSGYAVHGLFVTWLPQIELLQNFRLDAGVENIFDKTYRRHLASLYEEGRDYRVAVSYTKGF